MKNEHLGLKLIGIIIILSGIVCFFAGFGYMSLGSAVDEVAEENILLLPVLLPVAVSVAIVGGLLVGLSIFMLFFGYFIYKERRWAYFLLFILAGIDFIIAITVFDVLSLIISLLIMCYLYIIRKDFLNTSSDYTIVEKS